MDEVTAKRPERRLRDQGSMARKIHNLLESLLASRPERCHEACFQPSVDVYRGKQGWLLKFDLAGVRIEDVQINLQGRRLSVRGVRRDWCIVEGQQAYSMEIAYNRFDRTVELPIDLVQAQVASEYRDGMLLVRISQGGTSS
jgi:HSP20 family protein